MPTEQLDCGSDKVFHPFCVQHTGIQADVQRCPDENYGSYPERSKTCESCLLRYVSEA